MLEARLGLSPDREWVNNVPGERLNSSMTTRAAIKRSAASVDELGQIDAARVPTQLFRLAEPVLRAG